LCLLFPGQTSEKKRREEKRPPPGLNFREEKNRKEISSRVKPQRREEQERHLIPG